MERTCLFDLNLPYVSSPNIGPPSITTYHTRNRALYHTETYSSSRSTVSCPAKRDLTCRKGGKEKLEKDALSCSEAQLLEAVLETSTLKAAGREGWLSGNVSGQGLQWPKKTPCNNCLIWSQYCFIIKMANHLASLSAW